MKIYVVTKGSYSDYHIITATTDPEKAKKIAEKFTDKWDDAKVEEYENSDIYLKNLWYVVFEANGEVKHVHLERSAFYYDANDEEYIGRIRCNPHLGLSNGAWIHVFADDEEGAIKIAAEKRAEFLAKKNGLN